MRASAHLVGSLPGDSARAAMTAALETVGPHLRCLPDGETGDRRDWIIHIIESLRRHPDLELRRDGAWKDYDDTPAFAVRPGHDLRADDLRFGHIDAFERSYPEFCRLRAAAGRDQDLRFLVGVPGDLDMALFALGPAGVLRHRAAFTQATVDEIRAIHARAGDDVVFQLELPADLMAVARVPWPAQPAAAAYVARGIVRLVDAAPVGARFGLHLCLGDMNHRALGQLRDTGPMVRLTNAIVARWPDSNPLDFVHLPLAAAVEPPPNRRGFYEPLRALRVPPDVALIAGFVHESLRFDVLQQLWGLLCDVTGRTVDVASSCGLGRRDRPHADAVLELTARLCAAVGDD